MSRQWCTVADLVRRCFIACGAAQLFQAPLGCGSSAHPCGGLIPQGIVLVAEMVQLLQLPLEAGGRFRPAYFAGRGSCFRPACSTGRGFALKGLGVALEELSVEKSGVPANLGRCSSRIGAALAWVHQNR